MKEISLKITAVLLALGALAFVADDKKTADKRSGATRSTTAKAKKKAVCCGSGIPARFTAAGAEALKRKAAPTAHK